MFSLHVNSLLLWENRFYFLFIQDALVFFIPSFKVIIPQWSYKHQTLLSVLPQPAWFLRLYFFSVSPANKQEAPELSTLPCILISTHHDDWYTSRRWTLVKEWLRYLVKILRPENTCLDGRKPWQTLCCLQSTHHLPQKSHSGLLGALSILFHGCSYSRKPHPLLLATSPSLSPFPVLSGT